MNESSYWQAVLQRDRCYDGAFVYAVRSTGIYCRPSCASRKPKTENVSFFPLPEIAEQAGFRPCKRCKPDQAIAHDPQVDHLWREKTQYPPPQPLPEGGLGGEGRGHKDPAFVKCSSSLKPSSGLPLPKKRDFRGGR
ncbi:MAG: hypothetical protein HYS70_04995 [Nitrospinae bacterium]|nr:hypothetical protein [Nitrospinota bacterium]